MDFHIPLILVIILGIGGVLFYKYKNTVPLSSVLADNRFCMQPGATEEVQQFVMALLAPSSIDETYQGTAAGKWDETSWFITVDPGGEDPPIRLLTWEQHVPNLPNCVIGRCVGI